MIYAFDIDEVTLGFVDPYFKFLSEKYGRHIHRSQLTSHSAEGSGLVPPGTSKQNLLEFIKIDGFKKLDPLPGALEVIRRITARHTIFFVTSRLAESREDTFISLEKFGLSYIPVAFSTSTVSKGDIVRFMKADVFIDDHPDFITDVKQKAPSCKTVLLSDIPDSWNKCSADIMGMDWKELQTKRPDLF